MSLRFEVLHRPDYSLLSIALAQGQKVFAEPAAMATMTPGIELKAGLRGGLGGALSRALGGESLIVNTFTARSRPGELTLAPGPGGDVVHYSLKGGRLLLSRGAYLANGDGVQVTGKWGGARGFFSGTGLVLLEARGQGDVFFNSYGAILELSVGEGLVVDTGYVVAFEDTLSYEVSVLSGLSLGGRAKSFFFGGEGLVVRFRGEGKVWVQSRAANPFLTWVYPYRPVKQRD